MLCNGKSIVKKDLCSEFDYIFVISIEIIKYMNNQLNGH